MRQARVTAAIAAAAGTAADEVFSCRLRVDSRPVPSSNITVSAFDATVEWVACPTHATVTVTADMHTVDLEASGLAAGLVFDTANLTAMFVPFVGSGHGPSS